MLQSAQSKGESEVAQSCPTLWDPMDCSLPGSSAHGIFQARLLEWVAISSSRGSSRPRDQKPFPPPGDLPDPGIKSNKQNSPMTQKLKLSDWKLKELLGWPKSSFSFLSKNKRHIFYLHQELSFLFFFFLPRTLFNNVFTVLFHYLLPFFSGNFIIPSSQNIVSF